MSGINVWLRSNQKLFLVLICCVVILGWYVMPHVAKFFMPAPLPGGRIFGEKVPAKEVMALAQCVYAIVGKQMRIDPAAIAWQTLILDAEAKRYGIAASETDVATFLENRFKGEGGGIDEQAYMAFLRENSLSRNDFETAVRTLSTGTRLQQTVARGVSLTDNEARAWYNHRGQRVKVRYIELRADNLVPLVSVEEDALRAFHRKHANTPRTAEGPGYLNSEQVKIEYIMAAYEKYEKAAAITPEQIAAYYEANKEQKYRLPDPPRKEEKPPEGEAEANADATGEKELETPVPSYKSLAEVSEEIEKTLRREEAERVVDDTMREVNDEVWKAYESQGDMNESAPVKIAAIGKHFDMEHKVTPFFSSDNIPANLRGAEGLADKAFGQGVRSIGRPTTTLSATSGKFIFQILDIQPPQPAAFETVRTEVGLDLRKEKALNLATEFAGLARSEADLNAAADALSGKIAELLGAMPEEARRDKTPQDFFNTGESKYFDRPEYWGYMMTGETSKTGLRGPYSYMNFAGVAFTLGATGIEMAIEETGPRAVYLLERADMQQPDATDWEKSGAMLSRRLLDEKRMAVMETWWADLRRRAHPSDEAMKFLKALPEWSGQTR